MRTYEYVSMVSNSPMLRCSNGVSKWTPMNKGGHNQTKHMHSIFIFTFRSGYPHPKTSLFIMLSWAQVACGLTQIALGGHLFGKEMCHRVAMKTTICINLAMGRSQGKSTYFSLNKLGDVHLWDIGDGQSYSHFEILLFCFKSNHLKPLQNGFLCQGRIWVMRKEAQKKPIRSPINFFGKI